MDLSYNEPVKLFLSRNNLIRLIIKWPQSGDVFTEDEMAEITQVLLKYNGTGLAVNNQYVSSLDYPSMFDLSTYAATSEIQFDFTNLAFKVGHDQTAELIIFTNEYSYGVVVAQLDITVSDEAQSDAILIDPGTTNLTLNDITGVNTTGAEEGDILKLVNGVWIPSAGAESQIDSELAEDLSFSGPRTTDIVGEAVAFGNFLYRNRTDKKWRKAKADDITTLPALRMALATSIANSSCLMLCPGGVARNDAWSWTDDGSILELYLSASVGGALTETPDTSPGNFGQVVATPLAVNQIQLLPSLNIARY